MELGVGDIEAARVGRTRTARGATSRPPSPVDAGDSARGESKGDCVISGWLASDEVNADTVTRGTNDVDNRDEPAAVSDCPDPV